MNNILIIIPDQLIKPMGGMGEQARNLFTYFDKEYHFDVIGSADTDYYIENNISFYPIMDLKSMSGNPDPISNVFLNQALFVESVFKNNIKPDIVHAFDWSTFWAGRILANHFNVPLVTTVQLSINKHIENIHSLQKMQHDLAISIEISGLIESAAIIQVSESYAKLFPSFLLPKTSVIHNGINLTNWVKDIDIKLPGDRKYKLVYIGRFAEMKNIQTLFQCKIPDEIDLIFIGDSRGGDATLFDAMVDYCRNTPNAHYVGPKYGQEKVDWLIAADAVIVPSRHEPFGIVALEALASKSILLSSFVNGMGDFLNEDCAINCGTSVESIEHAIDKFLHITQVQKEAYVNAGERVCLAHSWYLQAYKLEQVYAKVLQQHEAQKLPSHTPLP